MELEELKCLLCLAQKQDWTSAAQACGLSESALMAAIRVIEAEWARDFCFASEELKQRFAESRRKAAIAPLLKRRSVSPKRLCAPGPNEHDMGLIVQAGLHAPDHGGLHPWRLIAFHEDQRALLATRFEAEKRRRDPLASAADLQRAREHALRPPVLVAFVVSPKPRTRVPAREQWLAAGAALGNLLNAAHQLGFGAIVLSGERCFDPVLSAELGVQPEEFVAGFISFGSVAETPPARKHAAPGDVLSRWVPGDAVSADAASSKQFIGLDASQPDGSHR